MGLEVKIYDTPARGIRASQGTFSSCHFFHFCIRILRSQIVHELGIQLERELCCWHLILCRHNVDILDICIKKFDVLKLVFDKMAAF